MIEVREIAHGSAEYAACVELRREILRRPLGLDFDPAQLAAEDRDIHLAAYRDGALVGCLILTPLTGGDLKMRQVAVAEAAQGSGVGRALVEASESLARERGFERIVLNARQTAVPFYERLAYACEGEPFEEVGIPHRRMARRVMEMIL